MPSPASSPLILEKQGSFFVGGRTIQSGMLSRHPAFEASGTFCVDQVYVRFQIPASTLRQPLILVHGCCMTGKTWETTPDGRMGWDEYFLRQGHPVYVVDQAWRGRSAADVTTVIGARAGQIAPGEMPAVFMNAQQGAWKSFRFGPDYPNVFPGLQFPVHAIDELWKQMVPDWSEELPAPNPTVPAILELAGMLRGAVVISHSQSGFYPFQAAAMSSSGIRGIISIEPGECPPADGDLAPYMDIPIQILWGDYVDQSPRWSPRLESCQQFVTALNAAGGHAENTLLPDIGILGNSHILMQDMNSLDIAEWISDWIERCV
ncbi:esterase [Paraburkholderia sediminicola]|uniref:esterase n=1 Tax=Paraburkholderia sediminicola TaxID=458836 RepID=UPI0038B81777